MHKFSWVVRKLERLLGAYDLKGRRLNNLLCGGGGAAFPNPGQISGRRPQTTHRKICGQVDNWVSEQVGDWVQQTNLHTFPDIVGGVLSEVSKTRNKNSGLTHITYRVEYDPLPNGTYISRIYSELGRGQAGTIYAGQLTNHAGEHIDIAVKVQEPSRANVKELIIHMLVYCTQKLATSTGNGCARIPKILTVGQIATKRKKKHNHVKKDIIAMQKLDGKLTDLLEEIAESEEVSNIVFTHMCWSVATALKSLQKRFKFQHRDLIHDNIMYTWTDKRAGDVTEQIVDALRQGSITWYIIDFGMSIIYYKGVYIQDESKITPEESDMTPVMYGFNDNVWSKSVKGGDLATILMFDLTHPEHTHASANPAWANGLRKRIVAEADIIQRKGQRKRQKKGDTSSYTAFMKGDIFAEDGEGHYLTYGDRQWYQTFKDLEPTRLIVTIENSPEWRELA